MSLNEPRRTRGTEWTPDPIVYLQPDMLPGVTEMRVMRAIARLTTHRERPSKGAPLEAIHAYCLERRYPTARGFSYGFLWRPSEGTVRNRIVDLMNRDLVQHGTKDRKYSPRAKTYVLTDRGRSLMRRLESWDPMVRIVHAVKEEVV